MQQITCNKGLTSQAVNIVIRYSPLVVELHLQLLPAPDSSLGTTASHRGPSLLDCHRHALHPLKLLLASKVNTTWLYNNIMTIIVAPATHAVPYNIIHLIHHIAKFSYTTSLPAKTS